MKRILAFLLFMASPAMASFSGFTYRRTITVNHTQISTGTLNYVNFPMLLQVTDGKLSPTSVGGHLSDPNGYDLVFSSDPSCASQYYLNWDTETVNLNGTTQDNIFVKIPAISSTTDTTEYMCYGSTSVSTYKGVSTGTWDSNYLEVLHLGNAGALVSGIDSTSNRSANFVANSTPTSLGQIDGAGTFTPNTDQTMKTFISLPNTGAISTLYLPETISLWYNTFSNTSETFIYSNNNDSNTDNTIGVESSGLFYVSNNAACGVQEFLFSGGASPITTNIWHYVSVIASGTISSPTFFIQVDSSSAQQFSGTSLSATPCSGSSLIGKANFSTAGLFDVPFNGLIDEVEISNTARSADWTSTQYNNQFSPATFSTLGPEIGGAPLPFSMQINGTIKMRGKSVAL